MEEHYDIRSLVPAVLIGIILLLLVFVAFLSAKDRTGTIVLPGGITYLGPTTTPEPTRAPSRTGLLSIPPGVTWNSYQGKLFPYHFSYPANLSLGVFPNDPYDAVTVFTSGNDGSGNVFFRVDTLPSMNKSHYSGKTEQYARDWWKSYSWKGVRSVTSFQNSKGLTGFRATYIDTNGDTPYDHVFFSVPTHPDYVIWVSGRLFDEETFVKIIDSVSWGD